MRRPRRPRKLQFRLGERQSQSLQVMHVSLLISSHPFCRRSLRLSSFSFPLLLQLRRWGGGFFKLTASFSCVFSLSFHSAISCNRTTPHFSEIRSQLVVLVVIRVRLDKGGHGYMSVHNTAPPCQYLCGICSFYLWNVSRSSWKQPDQWQVRQSRH